MFEKCDSSIWGAKALSNTNIRNNTKLKKNNTKLQKINTKLKKKIILN